mmetsp:Transcript_2255/g.3463  ORF Transcript_2255/g.3463 Transcript_2255/m.3463 type:complete len:579 (+) Transcript_2255:144-1880(+)
MLSPSPPPPSHATRFSSTTQSEEKDSYPSSNSHIADSFFCLICYSEVSSGGYKLPCQHTYCRLCLEAYVESNIIEGKVHIKCFHIDDYVINSDKNECICNAVIPVDVVRDILSEKHEMREKFDRFHFLKSNSGARECPHCQHLQIGSSQSPSMVCDGCGGVYCFSHALAHPPDISCSDYEASTQDETRVNSELISIISKPCPGCGIAVCKSEGCNHMKCPSCEVSFCWLCGKRVDDAVFPTHYQWWNIFGCANMQMVDAVEPSTSVYICARLLAILQLLTVGPLSIVSSIVSFLLCLPCVACSLADPETRRRTRIREHAGYCITVWGFFWIFLLLVFPICLGLGTLVLVFVLIVSPCYIFHRMKMGMYPFPQLVRALSTIEGPSPSPAGANGSLVLCSRGHPLTPSSARTPWMCDASREPGGCRSGTGASTGRWRCSAGCDFDYCQLCYTHKQSLLTQINSQQIDVENGSCDDDEEEQTPRRHINSIMLPSPSVLPPESTVHTYQSVSISDVAVNTGDTSDRIEQVDVEAGGGCDSGVGNIGVNSGNRDDNDVTYTNVSTGDGEVERNTFLHILPNSE